MLNLVESLPRMSLFSPWILAFPRLPLRTEVEISGQRRRSGGCTLRHCVPIKIRRQVDADCERQNDQVCGLSEGPVIPLEGKGPPAPEADAPSLRTTLRSAALAALT